MTDLHTLIEGMEGERRAGALQVLDAISRPMNAREIEGALRLNGVPRSRAIKLASTVKHFHIIAMAGPEVDNG